MRISNRPRLIGLGLTLALILASLGQSNISRRLAADESQVTQQEKAVAESDDQTDQKTPSDQNTSETRKSRFNIAMKTGGGTQLWTDHRNREGYRVQQNVLTGHWRTLDANDVRQCWGTRDQCCQILDDLKPKPTEAPEPKHFVVLLHGLMRTHHSMKPVAASLAEAGHEDVIRFAYASTRSSIADHSQALLDVLEDLPPNTEFSFVGHSMGNIVVRHMIGRLQQDDPHQLLGRFRSMVMLGPPNQGAAISRRLAPTGLYGLITGQGGLELGPQWEEFVKQLATPPFPFMIIAGDISGSSLNPLVDGSGDFVVSVDEAELEGAESLETVPVLHSFLMNDAKAKEMTVNFIQQH